ncbi:MAG: hypothetical protein KKH28_05265 [Elusimicrobia bacterium]|nr:hypothetical protein [Elusimicrobiota bacterium]
MKDKILVNRAINAGSVKPETVRPFKADHRRITVPAAVLLLILASWSSFFQISTAHAGAYEELASHAESLGLPSPQASNTGSDWQLVPPPPPDTASPMQTGEFNSGELNFWQELGEDTGGSPCRQGLLDSNLCRNFGLVGPEFVRALKNYPDGTLALVEKIGLNLALGKETQLLNIGGNMGNFNIGISGGVRLAGTSIVVTPLGKKEWNTEIMRLIKIWKTRTIIPFNAGRIMRMRNGEIWKLPIVIWAGFAPTVGVGAGPVPVSLNVSFGMSGEHLPTLSLFRAGDRELRLRLRIDQAVMRFIGGGLNISVTPVTVGLDKLDTLLTSKLDSLIRPVASNLPLVGKQAQNAGGFIGHFAAGQIAREFMNYTYASFGVSANERKGKKMMAEYIFDPTDKEQMEALVKLVKAGGFDMPRQLARIASVWSFLPGHNSVDEVSKLQQIQQDWQREHPDMKPSYAGASGYRKDSRGMNLHVPLIVNYNSSHGAAYEKIKEQGGAVRHVNQSFRNTDDNFIDIPWFGKVFKHNQSRSAYVLNTETSSGGVNSPMMVYQQFDGMIRRSERAGRGSLEKINGIMRYAGVMGEGENPSTSLPLDSLQPISSHTARLNGFDLDKVIANVICPNCTSRYRATMVNFSLGLNENAVSDIIAAPCSLILKAFANSLGAGAKELMQKVLSVSKIGEDGAISYLRGDLEKVIDLSVGAFREFRILRSISKMCRTATRIIQDLIKVRTASGWKERAEAIGRLTSGEGKSKLRYGDIMKVLIQLVKPSDIAAEIKYSTNRKEDNRYRNVSLHYSYNGNPDNTAFQGMSGYFRLKDRFSAPAELAD